MTTTGTPTARAHLIEVDDSILVVIDVQAGFLEKMDTERADAVVEHVAWLSRVAGVLGVPVVVTAEEPDGYGGAVDLRVAAALPPGTEALCKPVFGLAACPPIMAAVEATGRRTAVLVGLDTDVCVAHSALGLLERAYTVAAVADALGSSGSGRAHEFGLDRLRSAGVALLGTRNLYYEWVPSVERAMTLREPLQDFPMPGGW